MYDHEMNGQICHAIDEMGRDENLGSESKSLLERARSHVSFAGFKMSWIYEATGNGYNEAIAKNNYNEALGFIRDAFKLG
jgi:hypothetical protein